MYTQQLQDNTRWHQQQQEKKVIVIKTGKEKQQVQHSAKARGTREDNNEKQ